MVALASLTCQGECIRTTTLGHLCRSASVFVLNSLNVVVHSHSGGFCGTLTAAGLKCCGGQIEDDPAGKSAEMIGDLLAEMSCERTRTKVLLMLVNTRRRD